jgi:hypothetical protein
MSSLHVRRDVTPRKIELRRDDWIVEHQLSGLFDDLGLQRERTAALDE